MRAWYETYGLPTIITNCSNNYGPYQYPEKLIPVVILNGINGRPIPLYGAGDQVRDWLFVEDHARALALVLKCGRTGETYAISGRNERRNVDLAHAICDLLDERLPGSRSRPHRSLISFVADRPGHDRRYALDSGKIERELGWSPRESLDSGLVKTVDWYLGHQAWCDALPGRQSVGERRGLLR